MNNKKSISELRKNDLPAEFLCRHRNNIGRSTIIFDREQADYYCLQCKKRFTFDQILMR